MLHFVNGTAISVAIGVAAALWQAKPGNRLKDSLGVAVAILVISLAGGLAVLMGFDIKGISN